MQFRYISNTLFYKDAYLQCSCLFGVLQHSLARSVCGFEKDLCQQLSFTKHQIGRILCLKSCTSKLPLFQAKRNQDYFLRSDLFWYLHFFTGSQYSWL